jgi:putative DNA primase/helicase
VTAADIDRSRRFVIEDWLGDFPFATDADKAGALALGVLPFVRDLIHGPTPLHLIDKPSPGTGATLLVSALTYLFTGRDVGAMTEGRDEDEWRKRMTAKLVGAPSHVFIDNLRRRLDSASVSCAITASSWEDRRLGHTEIMRVPVRCVWIATGNNPAVSTEISRRIVRIRLDAKVDRPWARREKEFRHPDLMHWTDEHRGELVSAVLTLAQAWLAAGRPSGCDKLGMFESWSQVIGGILSVAGLSGFLTNLEDFYAESDVEAADWRSFIEAWWHQFQGEPVGVSELYHVYEVGDQSLDLGIGDGSMRSQKTRLGQRLGEMRDRRFGDWRISYEGKRQGASRWRLAEATDVRPACEEMEEVDLAH